MSTPDEDLKALSCLINEAEESVVTEYVTIFTDVLGDLGLCNYNYGAPVPLTIWRALAEVFADASGYRIIMQATILEPIPEDTAYLRTVGHHEVTCADPRLFVVPADPPEQIASEEHSSMSVVASPVHALSIGVQRV